jgi:hypothetical protein
MTSRSFSASSARRRLASYLSRSHASAARAIDAVPRGVPRSPTVRVSINGTCSSHREISAVKYASTSATGVTLDVDLLPASRSSIPAPRSPADPGPASFPGGPLTPGSLCLTWRFRRSAQPVAARATRRRRRRRIARGGRTCSSLGLDRCAASTSPSRVRCGIARRPRLWSELPFDQRSDRHVNGSFRSSALKP